MLSLQQYHLSNSLMPDYEKEIKEENIEVGVRTRKNLQTNDFAAVGNDKLGEILSRGNWKRIGQPDLCTVHCPLRNLKS